MTARSARDRRVTEVGSERPNLGGADVLLVPSGDRPGRAAVDEERLRPLLDPSAGS